MDLNWGCRRIHSHFLEIKPEWTLDGLKTLVKNIKARDGDISRKDGSRGLNTAITPENIEMVQEMILSQEDAPGTHLTQRRIAANLGICQASVSGIASKKLGLRAYKKIPGADLTTSDESKRVHRCKKLLRYFTSERLSKTFFTDEKIFKLTAP